MTQSTTKLQLPPLDEVKRAVAATGDCPRVAAFMEQCREKTDSGGLCRKIPKGGGTTWLSYDDLAAEAQDDARRGDCRFAGRCRLTRECPMAEQTRERAGIGRAFYKKAEVDPSDLARRSMGRSVGYGYKIWT